MAGCIVGFYGPQRSGKTFMAYKFAESFSKQGLKIYSNMEVPLENWIQISGLSDVPTDYEPKVLLLDEAYYMLDARMWKDSGATQATIFFNTLGKQNILFIITAIDPSTIEKRLRDQHNYMFIVKSDINYIYYRIFDVYRGKHRDFTIEKTSKLFEDVKYNTLSVPDFVSLDLKDFNNRAKQNNNKNLGGRFL